MRKVWIFICGLLLTQHLFSQQFNVSQELVELLQITGVQCERTLPKIVEATQKAWLRPSGKERWEVEEQYDAAQQRQIVEICKRMGLLAEIRPKKAHYRYCCIFGAALPTIEKRLEFAAKLSQEGIVFQELVFLTGDRDLDERIDRVSFLVTLPKNETEGMVALYESMLLPAIFKSVPMNIVNTPKRSTQMGWLRPNTYDTLVYWLKSLPMPGTVLFISNQPYVCYQNATARNVLPGTFDFETVGCEASQGYFLRASLLLDTIARWLYLENASFE